MLLTITILGRPYTISVDLLVGIVLVLIVLGVAISFSYRQYRTHRALRHNHDLPPDERHFVRQQIHRRIVGSVLLFIFAGFLIGWFWMEPNFSNLKPLEDDAPMPAEIKDKLRFYTGYWIAALLVLLGLLAVAVLDLWATARYGLRNHKQLEAERRELFEEEAAKVRQRRSEMN